MGHSVLLIATWLSFASAVSGLPIPPGVVPVITLADHVGLMRIGRDLRFAAATYLDGRIVRVVLRKEWDAALQEDNCGLAHELTHVLQYANRQRFACEDASEPPAYRVQAACYRTHGDRRGERWALGKAARHGCR